jgi:hypothetical protein
MAALIVDTKNTTDLELIQNILKKMGIKSKVVTESEKEDMALGFLMQKADRTRKVSRNTIFRKLTN